MGHTDTWTDGQRKPGIEVGAPPKNIDNNRVLDLLSSGDETMLSKLLSNGSMLHGPVTMTQSLEINPELLSSLDHFKDLILDALIHGNGYSRPFDKAKRKESGY